MNLTEAEMKYLSKQIKDRLGIRIDFKNVRCTTMNTINFCERKKYLDNLVDTFVQIQSGNIKSVENVDEGLEFKTIDEFVGN